MSSLPIENVLPQLINALNHCDEAVLEAPPGAGKTTLVPLALLNNDWLAGQKILMLEPRRLAARAAAERMAFLLNETVGNTVGYRVRFDSRISQQTRIEVITEGILTRRLQDDPALDGVGLVIFDEFHERSLDADLGLALTLQGRDLFREDLPLKLLVMSATLDGCRVAKLLHNAPVIRSEGRHYPVAIHYGDPWQARDDMVKRTVSTIQQVLKDETGSLLVFLPGQREIRQVQASLQAFTEPQTDLRVTPLYGDLTLNEQRQAIEPTPAGQRKIVLATDIAETSLTIEGVRVVIDAGLSRKPMFNVATGMAQLHTCRVSKASSTQRMGRAGRLEPGVCYRLWSELQQQQLVPYAPAEILQADLVPLALQLLNWGVENPDELVWLDVPPIVGYEQALMLLERLGATVKNPSGHWQLTSHGEAMTRLPTHPRLAHLLLMGKQYGIAPLASDVAALLSERDPLSHRGADIYSRLALLKSTNNSLKNPRGNIYRIKQQSQQFKKLIQGRSSQPVDDEADPKWIGFLIACAYPERIAQKRNTASVIYRLSQGRSAQLRDDDALQQSNYLAVAQLASKPGEAVDRIFLAAELVPELFEGPLSGIVEEKVFVGWDDNGERLLAENQRSVGEIIIERHATDQFPWEEKRQAVCEMLTKRGLSLLPWNEDLRQWQRRVLLIRQLFDEDHHENVWPDVSDEKLLATLEQWLSPYVDRIKHIHHFSGLELDKILYAMLPWPLPQHLEQLAPLTYQVPSGSRIRIDYSESPPLLAVKLQEMFGCTETPAIAKGKMPLKVHLLSPARRPLQVTQDLKNFWHTSYHEIKKEMKGRYPKHHWPDDPMAAQATASVKRKPAKKS